MQSLNNGYIQPPLADKEEHVKQTNELIHEVILSLLACDGQLLNGYTRGKIEPKLQCKGSEKIFKALLGACKEFLALHDKELKTSVDTLNMSDLKVCDTFHETVLRIFSDGINYGRIVSAICVSKTMAARVMTEQRLELAESIIGWLQRIVADNLLDWILRHGGWVSYIM